jgi:hypothetical protein
MSEQPEGVPVGMRIKRVMQGPLSNFYAEMEPDNVYGKPLEAVPVPEHWERNGSIGDVGQWYRQANYCEWYISPNSGDAVKCYSVFTDDKVICVRAIKKRKRVLRIRQVDVTHMEPTKITLQYAMAGGNHLMELDFGIEECEE